MSHYDITDWADFAREMADSGDRTAMQSHLDDGCEPCQAMVAAFQRVATVAATDAALAPPAGALRSVKAFFAVQHPPSSDCSSPLTLRRIFDSAVAPATASRSSTSHIRQLLFESDDYTLELSVDQSPGAVDAVLRGQILEAHGEPRSHAPVFLVGSGEVLGQAISERHGTFELSGRLDPPCELWVFPDDDHRIRLRLEPSH